jgi:adenylate cyclase
MIARLRAWLRQNDRLVAEATTVSVAIIATFISVLLVRNVSVLDHTSQFVNDYMTVSLAPAEPQDKDVVIVAVEEDTLSQFPYRSPVDREFLANLLTALAAKHPRAIGVDFLFDQPTEPAKDELLKRTLRTLKVPLVVAYSDRPEVVDAGQHAALTSFVPKPLRGDVSLGEDKLDVVRWIFPGAKDRDGIYVQGFARAIATKLGVKTPSTLTPIAWHGVPDSKTLPFAEFKAQAAMWLPESWYKGKIVLIGSDLTLDDRHRTPFDIVNPDHMAGVFIQAHSLSQLLNGSQAPDVSWLLNLLIAFICAAMGARLGAMNLALLGRMGLGFGFVILLYGMGAGVFHYGGHLVGLVTPTLAMALSLWGTESLTGRQARRQREFIQGAFGRYVSPKLVERLVRDPDKMSLEGERRVMTYLFSDIANFTVMSEGLDSRELARVLNAYLDGCAKEVLKHDGMVDKFIGDAVFAIFNAPVDLPNHAEQAVKCALAMDRFAFAFSEEQKARGVPFGITRIGVHTGPAVIGNFGSSDRFNYTAQGDAVNTASRLEALNKHFHTRISVSSATKDLCPSIAFRPIAEVVLKGKSAAVEAWEPLHEDDPRGAFMARYTQAYEALQSCDPGAERMLAALAEEAPDDPCVRLHLTRLAAGESGTVIVMEEK